MIEDPVPAIGLDPTVEPVPHSYVAPVPKVAPTAESVVLAPLQIVVVPEIEVGATEGWLTVTVVVVPEVVPVQGEVVPVMRTQ